MSADAFGNFRNNSLNNYELCPGHYLSAPALSCNLSSQKKFTIFINFKFSKKYDIP